MGENRVDNGGNQKRTVLGVLADSKRANLKENKEKQVRKAVALFSAAKLLQAYVKI